ncbi:uncharacterized protein [Malus domestica]|uniref:uncharacterized protein n=1 Tax=Malus domestica TaxID=3750 RepID=UPI003974ECAA
MPNKTSPSLPFRFHSNTHTLSLPSAAFFLSGLCFLSLSLSLSFLSSSKSLAPFESEVSHLAATSSCRFESRQQKRRSCLPEREGRKKKADAIAEAANLMEMESSEKKMTSENSSSPKPNFEDPMKLNPSRTWLVPHLFCSP